MPKYRIETNRGTFEVEANREPTAAEVEAMIADGAQPEQRPEPKPATGQTPSPVMAAAMSVPGMASLPGVSSPDRGAAGSAVDMALEGGLPAAGQALGAMTGPAAPVAVPALGFVGGAGGNALAQTRRMAVGEQNRFLPGQMLASGVAGSVPGASLFKAGAREVAKQGARFGAANLAAKATETAVDERRLPTGAEAGLAAGAGALGAPLAKFAAPAPQDVKAIENAVLKETVREVRAAGYPVDPLRLKPSWATKKLASIAGKAATSQEVALRAQEVTTALARKELGMQAEAPLTRETLRIARQQAAEPYRQIASLSPQAGKDVEALNLARSEARGYWKSHGATGDYEQLKKARAADAEAQRLEGKIGDHAVAARDPGLVYELDAARTKIAKIHDVEDALELGDGNIAANVVLRAWDSGKKVSGNLKTIAKFASAFPMDARQASRVPTPGVNQLSPFGSAALATAAAGTAGPRGLLAGGIPLLADPARAFLLSERFQERAVNRFLNPPQAESYLPLAFRLGSMSAGR